MSFSEPIENLASRVVCGHNLVPPVDIESLASKYAKIKFAPLSENLDGISAFLKTGETPLIIVNSERPTSRIRFTLAHELGHVLIPWHIGSVASHIDGFEESSDLIYREMEREANLFASSILLPVRWIHQFDDAEELIGFVERAPDDLGVSRTAFCLSVIRRLPPGWMYVETDYQGMVAFTSQSPGSRMSGAFREGYFNALDFTSTGAEVYEYKNSINTVYFVHSSSISIEAGYVSTDWRTTLQEILSDTFDDEVYGTRIARSINAITGCELGRSSADSVDEYVHRLAQRFVGRSVIPRSVLSHVKFPEYIRRRASDYWERKSGQ